MTLDLYIVIISLTGIYIKIVKERMGLYECFDANKKFFEN